MSKKCRLPLENAGILDRNINLFLQQATYAPLKILKSAFWSNMASNLLVPHSQSDAHLLRQFNCRSEED